MLFGVTRRDDRALKRQSFSCTRARVVPRRFVALELALLTSIANAEAHVDSICVPEVFAHHLSTESTDPQQARTQDINHEDHNASTT